MEAKGKVEKRQKSISKNFLYSLVVCAVALFENWNWNMNLNPNSINTNTYSVDLLGHGEMQTEIEMITDPRFVNLNVSARRTRKCRRNRRHMHMVMRRRLLRTNSGNSSGDAGNPGEDDGAQYFDSGSLSF